MTMEQDAVSLSGGQYAYWRADNGEIKPVKCDDGFERLRLEGLGWTLLEEYEWFDYDFYDGQHPHEVLFQRGGAKELTLQEIIERGYHINPPKIPTCGLTHAQRHSPRGGETRGRSGHDARCWRRAKAVHFPQLKGIEVPSFFACIHCSRKDITSETGLLQHMSIMHREEGIAHGQANSIVTGIVSGLGGGSSAFPCPFCEMSAQSRDGLRSHIESAHLLAQTEGKSRSRKEPINA